MLMGGMGPPRLGGHSACGTLREQAQSQPGGREGLGKADTSKMRGDFFSHSHVVFSWKP